MRRALIVGAMIARIGDDDVRKLFLFVGYHLHVPWAIPGTLLVDTFAQRWRTCGAGRIAPYRLDSSDALGRLPNAAVEVV